MIDYAILFHKYGYSYSEYLMYNHYIVNTSSIQKATNGLKGQELPTNILHETFYDKLNQNEEFIRKVIGAKIGRIIEGFEPNTVKVVNENPVGFNGFEGSDKKKSSIANDLSKNIFDLNADFNMAMGKVLLSLEIVQNDMQVATKNIVKILKDKNKTDIVENFHEAIELYSTGCRFDNRPIWFKQAHKQFSQSIDQYVRNPLAHLFLAHIYHYQTEFQDFDKALEHYEYCFSYGEVDKKDYKIAAQGFFYAAWLQAAIFKNLDEAVNLSLQAIKYNPSIGEAYYKLSKYYALQNKPQEAIRQLRIAIIDFDRNYAIKVKLDIDFDIIKKDVNNLLLDLKQLAKYKFNKTIEPLNRSSEGENKELTIVLQEIDKALKADSYFGYLDTQGLLEKKLILIKGLTEKQEKQVGETRQEQKILKRKEIRALNLLAKIEGLIKISACKSTNTLATTEEMINHIKSLIASGKLTDFDEAISVANGLLIDNIAIMRHLHWVSSVAYSVDSKRIISGSYDKTIKIWDANTGIEINSLSGHSASVLSVLYSPDGKKIVSASYDKTIKIWDTSTGIEINSLSGHSELVTSVAYSPKGKYIISGSCDKTIKIWDANTGIEINSLSGHTKLVTSVVWSPNGRQIISGSYDKTIKIWDASTGIELNSLSGHSELVTSVAYSPDGRKIASASRDKTIKIWDAFTAEELNSFRGHTSLVTSVAWSPDSKQILSGSSDKTIKIWNASTGENIKSLRGHSNSVLSVAWSPNGKQMISGSYDKTIKIWDVNTGQPIKATRLLNRNWIRKVSREKAEQLTNKKDKQFVKDSNKTDILVREEKKVELEKITVDSDMWQKWKLRKYRLENGLCVVCGKNANTVTLKNQIYCPEHKK